MKILILIALVFTLSFVAYNQDAFAILGCDNPHCYSLVQSSRSSPIQGMEYELDSPDLWVDRNACLNIAVSTGWLVANPLPRNNGLVEWVESGVTKGKRSWAQDFWIHAWSQVCPHCGKHIKPKELVRSRYLDFFT